MLFSGLVQAHRCLRCNAIFSNVIPTSFIPIAIVVVASSMLWGSAIFHLIANQLIALLLGIITGTASFFLILTAILQWATRKTSNGICPACGGELKAEGGGFCDGGAPTRLELLTYALTLLIPLWAGTLLKSL